MNQINWMNDYITTTYVSPALFTYSTGGSTIGGAKLIPAADGTLVTPGHLCPDLLRYENIGAADGPRGRVVRGVFLMLRIWPPGERLPLLYLGKKMSNRCSSAFCRGSRRWHRGGAASGGGARDS